MDEQIRLGVALVLIALGSITVVVAVPTLALAAVRGNARGAIRLGVVTILVVALAIVVAAVVGSVPAAYSTSF